MVSSVGSETTSIFPFNSALMVTWRPKERKMLRVHQVKGRSKEGRIPGVSSTSSGPSSGIYTLELRFAVKRITLVEFIDKTESENKIEPPKDKLLKRKRTAYNQRQRCLHERRQ